jgi:hypothetical protein
MNEATHGHGPKYWWRLLSKEYKRGEMSDIVERIHTRMDRGWRRVTVEGAELDEILRAFAEVVTLTRERDAFQRGLVTAVEDNERLRALILDACCVFERYDLPEQAFHYRRIMLGKEQAVAMAPESETK